MKKTSRSHHGTLNELNITPLLDLAFVLLVIFIITTPQLVNHLEMTLPSSQVPTPPPDAPKPEITKILVDATGALFLNGRATSLAGLRTTLAALRGEQPQLAVVVNGSDEADYQNMVDVLDLLRQLDIERVGLATETVPAR
ncbi:MAG: biopolymer transporter ExbD [Verrucomicrobiales bacterium]|nr:biopolymer transporter ExbD [Verrucomicrobiales bacterium]